MASGDLEGGELFMSTCNLVYDIVLSKGHLRKNLLLELVLRLHQV